MMQHDATPCASARPSGPHPPAFPTLATASAAFASSTSRDWSCRLGLAHPPCIPGGLHILHASLGGCDAGARLRQPRPLCRGAGVGVHVCTCACARPRVRLRPSAEERVWLSKLHQGGLTPVCVIQHCNTRVAVCVIQIATPGSLSVSSSIATPGSLSVSSSIATPGSLSVSSSIATPGFLGHASVLSTTSSSGCAAPLPVPVV